MTWDWIDENFLSDDEAENSQALGQLVVKCIGKKLDKSNQFSNWENRPLRSEQLTYAALDAYCLIEIYDVLKVHSEKIDIDYNEFVNNFLTENKHKILPKKNAGPANEAKNSKERSRRRKPSASASNWK